MASLRVRNRAERKAEFQERTAERYADHLGRSKGVLMKVGQILSFTNIGPAVGAAEQNVYMRALSRLQDNAPPMPYGTVAEVIEREIGDPEVVFAEFGKTPVAAASIGQVHAATLHDGRRVAVKVQYPGVDEAIRSDLKNGELIATFLQVAKGFAPQLAQMDVRAMAAEIADRIGDEIDYEIEAANQSKFAEFFRGHPYIRVPEVVPELTTRRILTMDFVEGMRFAEAAKASAGLRDKWGEAIVRFTGGSLRRMHVFNADPHPGNYLFHEDGGVTFLDFGCVKEITADQARQLTRIANASVEGDAEATVGILNEMGFHDATGKVTVDQQFEWFRCGMEMFTHPQPMTMTSALAAQVIADKYSPFGPHGGVLRAMKLESSWAMFSRIDLGLGSILGALNSTGPWNAIRREWDCGDPPATPMGDFEAELFGKRVS